MIIIKHSDNSSKNRYSNGIFKKISKWIYKYSFYIVVSLLLAGALALVLTFTIKLFSKKAAAASPAQTSISSAEKKEAEKKAAEKKAAEKKAAEKKAAEKKAAEKKAAEKKAAEKKAAEKKAAEKKAAEKKEADKKEVMTDTEKGFAKSKTAEKKTTVTEASKLNGVYSYGTYVAYKFDGKGKGTMLVDEKKSYPFTYTLKNGKLTINLTTEGYADTFNCTISESGKLCLTGIGDTRGYYELKKE